MSSKLSSAQRALATIDDLLRAIGANPRKYAAYDGKPLSECGSVGGHSEHPTADAPDGLIELETGSHAQENTEDVQEMIGPASLDARPEESKSSEDATKAPDGTNAKATGEDPENETESLKGDKDDSPTTHPASTENPEIVTRKYSAMTDQELIDRFARLSNELLDSLDTVESPTKIAEAAGISGIDPAALEAEIAQQTYAILKSAEETADRTVQFLPLYWMEKQALAQQELAAAYYQEELRKAAAVEWLRQELVKRALLEAALGDEGAPAGDAIPPEALMMAALQDGAVPGAEAPAPEATPADEAEQLATVLEALGVTPEDLVGALEEEAAQPEAPAEAPAEEESDDEEEVKSSADRRGARLRKTSRTAASRQTMRDYIQELIARSKR